MAALSQALASALALVLTACTSPGTCEASTSDDGDCPDLVFSGSEYDEWRPVDLPDVTEELGDARYPACNDREECSGPDLDGHGASDVWLLEGVDPQQALIGYRQGSETPVIFLRQGVAPSDVPGLPAR